MGIHPHETRSHVVIDGRSYPTIKTAYAQAVRRGFNGSWTCFYERVMAGRNTWESLMVTVPQARKDNQAKGNKTKEKKKQSARDEMAALMAEMDARKAAMPR